MTCIKNIFANILQVYFS